MNNKKSFLSVVPAALLLSLASNAALATPHALDVTNANNGLIDIFSQTFAGNLQNPSCTGLSGLALRDCQFFIGVPGSTRSIVITPNPTRVANIVPGGITGAGSGSFLDLTLNGSNTQVTLAGGTIAFPAGLVLTIQNDTVVAPSGIAGFVIEPTSRVVSLDSEGVAEIRVSINPATAADFSTFNVIVQPGDCAGPFCGLIPLLTLDMVRYRLIVDYDPTFTSFTASFIGQTGNTSLVFATLISVAPEIAVTDSRAPSDDLSVPFGSVTELTTATQTVTVTNTGTSNLLIGTVADTNPVAAPFSLLNDTCTGATVLPAAACTFNVRFSPASTGAFSDSLDIPSNDVDEPSVTVALSGTGTAAPVPNITVTDSVAPAADGLIPFGTAAIGAQVDQTVTVTNDGNAGLLIGNVATANGLAAPYSIVSDNCSTQTIAPAGSCTIGVRFEPTAAGATSDSFDIPSNDVTDPTVTVSVSGTGAAVATPNIAVTDDTLPANDLLVPFGNVTEATTRDRIITVTNSGTANLVLGAVAGSNPLAAPFNVQTDGCSEQTLAPAANCNVIVRYSPVAAVSSSDSLNIPSNDPDQPALTVDVNGTGIVAGDGGVDTPNAEGASSGFMAIDPATLLLLGAAGVWGWRRRTAR